MGERMSRLLLQTLLTRQAEPRPDAVALVMGQERMTYGELELQSNQIARLLHDIGLRRGDRVGVLMHKCPSAVSSFLGVLKADCAYVPMDPGSPPARLGKIVDACEPRCILAAGTASGVLGQLLAPPAHGAIPIGWLGEASAAPNNVKPAFNRQDVLRADSSSRRYQNDTADAAHILFTSGSSGVPKGVVITHANVAHFVEWAIRYFDIGPFDRNSGHSPLQFDLSTFDIYGTLAAGAQLHLVSPELNLVPAKLAEFVRSSELTQWFSAPAILNHLAKFDAVHPNDFPTLKRLLWCGEVFPTPSLIYWMKRLPHVTFTNLYGPTEATIASSYYTVPECPQEQKAEIPIGMPCDGEALLVLDDELRPVTPGEIGWLYIRGVGLSPGYWRDPDKTKAAFVTSPHLQDSKARIYKTGDLARVGTDGMVYYLGRADSQIKCRGYRIELGEVETAINAIGGLRECAVVAVGTDGLEGTAICCAFVPEDPMRTKPAELRKELARVVPAYMLPSRWLAFDLLPKNSNGKIDRPKLREYFSAPSAASMSGLERAAV
jgi:amino acid adenylation domain-containing protein